MNLINYTKFRNNVAIRTEEGNCFRYKDLEELQKKFESNIVGRPLICILAENNLESIIGYLTCIKDDYVAMLLSADTAMENVFDIFETYIPSYVWGAKEILNTKDSKTELTIFLRENYKIKYSLGKYQLLERRDAPEVKIYDELILLLATSGSTGSKKFVRISKNNLYSNTYAICQYMKLIEEDMAIMALPISYTYGLSVLNTFLSVGATIFLTSAKIMQKKFWELMQDYPISFLPTVSFTLECMKKLHVEKLNMKKLRIISQAGGKLSNELQLFWGEYARRNNVKFFVMYGQTEATARITYLPYKKVLEKIGGVGIAIPGSKIKIFDKNKNDLTCQGKKGEVVCVGKQVSLGYAKSINDLEKGDSNKGILYTGDIGYIDKDGCLFLTGRKNRNVKILGKRFDLSYIEEQAEIYFGSEVIALESLEKIILYTDAIVQEDTMKKLLKHFSLGINIFVVKEKKEVPRNENGKIQYYDNC